MTDAEWRAEKVLFKHGVGLPDVEETRRRSPEKIEAIIADIRRINGKPLNDEDPEC